MRIQCGAQSIYQQSVALGTTWRWLGSTLLGNMESETSSIGAFLSPIRVALLENPSLCHAYHGSYDLVPHPRTGCFKHCDAQLCQPETPNPIFTFHPRFFSFIVHEQTYLLNKPKTYIEDLFQAEPPCFRMIRRVTELWKYFPRDWLKLDLTLWLA